MTSPKRVHADDDEIKECKPVAEEEEEEEDVDTSGDHGYALALETLLKETEEKNVQAKRKQQRDDERLAMELQMRLADEERKARKATVKVIEISSSDSDQDGRIVVKQENGSVKREFPELVKRTRLPITNEETPGATMRHKKATNHKKEKKRDKEERRSHKRKHAKKKARTSSPPSVAPPSVGPPSASPPSVRPPSVSPPSVGLSPLRPSLLPPSGKNTPLPRKRGRKPKKQCTIDEYIHIAKTMSFPRFETPTVALRTLHRGHLLLEVTSPSVLRNIWHQVRTGITSPLHDSRTAHALGATAEQLEELRKLASAYDRQQIVQQEQAADKPVEPLIADQMEARAEKEKKARKDAKEARGETVGKSLLKASQELVQATKDAMKMYSQLHALALERVEDNFGHLSTSSESEASSSDYEDGSSD